MSYCKGILIELNKQLTFIHILSIHILGEHSRHCPTLPFCDEETVSSEFETTPEGLHTDKDAESQFDNEVLMRKHLNVFSEEDRVFFKNSDESKIEDNTAKGYCEGYELWEDEEINVDFRVSHTEREASSGTTGDTCSVIQVVSLFLLLWQWCYGVSGVAITALLKFIRGLLLMLAEFSGSVFIKSIVKTFPINIRTIKSIVGIDSNEFVTYSICPKCYAIYTKEQSTKVLRDGHVISEHVRTFYGLGILKLENGDLVVKY